MKPSLRTVFILCLLKIAFLPPYLFASGVPEPSSSVVAVEVPVERKGDGAYWQDPVFRISPRYAKGFSVRYGTSGSGEYALLSVERSWAGAAAAPALYLLLPPDSEVDTDTPEFAGALPVSVPVHSIATLSSTYLHPLVMLGLADAVVAHDAMSSVGDEEILERFDVGKIVEVGNGPGLDIERLLMAAPDIVMTTGASGEWNLVPLLAKGGLTAVLNGDYLEASPLARAEWIKFIALFFGKEQEAKEIFSTIEKRYRETAELTSDLVFSDRPTVLLNNPFGGSWTVPGGESYMARLIKDAGGRYLWDDVPGTGSVSLDLEAVFLRAYDADIWLHQYGWGSLDDVRAADPRFADFRAVRNGAVINNDKARTPGGGNEFYGSGIIRPDLILSDLVAIFHPDLLPDHHFVYYRPLSKEGR